MIKKTSFKVSSNIKNLVGKNLVTDKYAAIYELVKNAYDADAKEVHLEFYNVSDTVFSNKNKYNNISTLVISDDGNGMSENDFMTKWMVIGTNSKRDNNYSHKYGRVYSGDKGIGRFSTDRLGKELNLISYPKNISHYHCAYFDWSKFDKYTDNISTIDIELISSEKESNNKSGLILEIFDLRDDWTQEEIMKLLENLRHLKNPFEFKHDFKVFVSAYDYGIVKKEIKKYNFESMSSLTLKGRISSGKIMLDIITPDEKHHESHINEYEFGEIDYHIYYFDKGDKRRFHTKMKQSVKEYGNIRAYYDGFQIQSYGENLNDWLGLDRRSLQKLFGRFFTTNDLIGYVSLSKLSNSKIIPATARQGLIENKYLKELKDCLVTFGVEILEKYYYNYTSRKRQSAQEEAKLNFTKTQVELVEVAKELKTTHPDVSNRLIKLSKTQEKSQKSYDELIDTKNNSINVYKRNAKNATILNEIIHNALISLKSSDENIINMKDDFNAGNYQFMEEDIDLLYKEVVSAKGYLLEAKDNLLGKKYPVKIKLSDYISDYMKNNSLKFENNNIIYMVDVEKTLSILIDRNDLRTIFDNIIDNSIKALTKSADNNKIIEVVSYKTSKYVYIVFRDNGIGISSSIRNLIFEPFFSRTDGFGLGLSIVDDIVESYNGELFLGNTENSIYTEIVVRLNRW